jgi:putative ABC transport system permease protein
VKILSFAPLVAKQVLRHRTRSLLTAGGVMIAMFLFCGVDAMQRGARAAAESDGAETTLVVYRKDRYCPFTSRMPQSYERRIAAVPGVAAVVPMQITVNNCRTSLDVVTFRGVPSDAFLATYAPDFDIVAGSLDEWSSRSDAALLGRTLALRRGLAVGDRFDAAGITVYVAGVFSSAEAQHQNVAYVHLAFLQFASGSRSGGIVTQFNVRVDDSRRLDEVADAIDAEFASDQEPTHTRSEKAFMAQAAADILEIVAFTRWLGIACLAGVLALVANAIVLAVQDRVREHAVLQTLGFRGGHIAGLIVAEGAALSLAGGVAGAVLAAGLLSWGQFALSVEGNSLPIAAGPATLAWGLVLSVALGVVAGLVPAWQAGRRPITECFRAV